MNLKTILSAGVLLATLVSALGATPPLPTPAHGTNPLLYVRFYGAANSRITLYPGGPTGREFGAPVTAGLRPGYIYRVGIANPPEYAGVTLYPTLEVRGTLQLPAQMRAADYPAPLVLTHEDVEQALAGALVTKVIYLEHPDRAAAVATRPDQPLELSVRADQDPVAEARLLGRPVLILRIGGRASSPEELAHESIPGTVLLPGEKSMAMPSVRPCLPWAGMPIYDPIAGPRPAEEECLHDGGDAGLRAGFDQDGRLKGLDPADTLAEYTDSTGQRHVAVSNRVCLCVPRFAVLRSTWAPSGYDSTLALSASSTALRQAVAQTKQPSLEARQREQLAAVGGRERTSATQASTGTIHLGQIQSGAIVIGQYQEKTVTGTCLEKPPQLPDRPLVLCKSVDKQAAQVGDVVTFTLKCSNVGGQPITNVAVADSLTGRLEYVAGSAKTDREASFTMKENEAGSLILRWEIAGKLLPGYSGLVSFQARVR